MKNKFYFLPYFFQATGSGGFEVIVEVDPNACSEGDVVG